MAENKLLSLTEIFNQRFFRIPDFQRGYSWNMRQLEDFWEDLVNLNKDKVHYTGLITVEPVYKNQIENLEKWQDDLWLFERNFKAYYLIDGQQRLTTSMILLNEILSNRQEDINFDLPTSWIRKFLYQEYKGNYKSYLFGYEKDNPSDEYFKTKILNQESSTADKVPEQTLYTANLQTAKQFFSEKLAKLTADEHEQLFSKLISKFKFNWYEIGSELDVYVTFETMNNRGKPLSNLELLKNRLIYLTTTLNNDSGQIDRLRKDINESWKTIYEYLGKNKNKPLGDDDFLYHHWIIYFGYNRKESESYAKFLLNQHFTVNAVHNNKIIFNDIQKYVISLSKMVKFWFYIHNPSQSQYSDEIKEWLNKLNRLGMGAFYPLVTVAISKDEQNLQDLLKSAERFIFLVFKISQRRSNAGNSSIYGYAHKYYFNKINLDKIIENIEDLTDGINENEQYIGYADLEYFQKYIKECYEKQEGFYSWNGLRYFLYEYELYLQKQAKGDSKISWQELAKRKKDETIEHIYPQTATNDYWKIRFNGLNKKEKNRFLNSLGNLVLLSRSKNSELQNFDFDYKKRHKNDSENDTGFCNGSYSEIEIAQYDEWTPDTIRKRGEKMLKFMNKRWNIQFDEWEIDEKTIL